MKSVAVNTGWQTQYFLFYDDSKADAAYATLKEAMQTYERFRNDKQKSISVTDGQGEMTFRTEHLMAVSLEDLSEAKDALFVEYALRNERLKRKTEQAKQEFTPVARTGEKGHDAATEFLKG
jgi:hypothetical protein